jgi:hypothetical protein
VAQHYETEALVSWSISKRPLPVESDSKSGEETLVTISAVNGAAKDECPFEVYDHSSLCIGVINQPFGTHGGSICRIAPTSGLSVFDADLNRWADGCWPRNLRFMVENDGYDHVNRLGEKLRAGLPNIIADHAPKYTVVGRDSLFKLVFTRDSDYDVSRDNGSQSSVYEERCRQRRHAHALMPVRKPEPR